MLVAQNHEKKLITLHSQISRKDLLELKNSNQFFCPQCNEKLILKVGTLKIPHFAHYHLNPCELTFSERESIDHLLGKEQLYSFFKKRKDTVPQLEPYLKEIQQRPDILVTTQNQNYAIEFQCSPIEDDLFSSRNKGYASIGIKPIWIPLTPQNIPVQKQLIKISLPKRYQKFFLRHKNYMHCITYHPHKKQFVYISNLLHVYGNQFLTKIIPLNVVTQKFPFYIPKQLTTDEFMLYFKIYNVIKSKYLQSRILLSRKGVNDIFLRSIYELKLSIGNLPNFLGIPMKGNEHLKLFSVEWQTALFYFIHFNDIKLSTLNGQAIRHFLQWMNLSDSNEAVEVVKSYCMLLQRLSIHCLSTSISDTTLQEETFRQFLAFNSES